ncbi:MAG: choice-of-anchor A family protein [Polyangiaceae bacterium]
MTRSFSLRRSTRPSARILPRFAFAAVPLLAACSSSTIDDAGASSQGAASTVAPTSCPAKLFGAASPLNVYSLGDIDYACSDFEGAVGAAGSIRLNRVAVNAPFYRNERGWVGVAVPTEAQFLAQRAEFQRLNAFTTPVDIRDYAWVWDPSESWNGETYGRFWDAAHAYVVGVSLSAGGSISLAELTVHAIPFEAGFVEAQADVRVHVPASPRHRVTMGTSRARSATTVDHARVSADLLDASRRIGDWTKTSVQTEASGVLTFPATHSLDVFEVRASELRAASSIRIEGSDTSLVFLNVVDAGVVDLSDLRDTIVLAGGLRPDGVLWNFPAATSLTMQNVVVPGTVLAPRAATKFFEGRVDGSLFVGSLDGSKNGAGEHAPTDALISCGSYYSGGQVNYWRFRGGL